MSAYELDAKLANVQKLMVKEAERLEHLKPTGSTQSFVNTIYALYVMSPLGYLFNNSQYNCYWRVATILTENAEPEARPSMGDH
jgi:hypothetical protein